MTELNLSGSTIRPYYNKSMFLLHKLPKPAISLTLTLVHSLSRSTRLPPRPIPEQKQPSFNLSLNRSQQSLLRKLKAYCRDRNKEDSQLLLDDRFYGNLGHLGSLRKVLTWQTSVAYFFRDFPMYKMGLENQRKLLKQLVEPELSTIRFMLMYLLTDHEALLTFISNKKSKSLHKSFFTLYLKSLCQLVVGELPAGETQLLQILNTPFSQLLDLKDDPEGPSISQTLLDKEIPQELNAIQQVFFNYLVFSVFKSAEVKDGKKTAGELFRKIKDGLKFVQEDFLLEDYQEFLNMWVCAKYGQPMKWIDLEEEGRVPYLRFLYLLAENAYISKDLETCNRILSSLPEDYPLRKFLQLSQLYDEQKYNQVIAEFEKLQQRMQNNEAGPYHKMPQFDIVVLMMMEIGKKAHVKINIGNYKGEEKELAQAMEEPLTLMRYNLNIRDNKAKGIPYYYFNIPFQDFMIDSHFSDLYS